MEQQSIASLYITVLFFMKISQLVYVPVMRAYNVTHTRTHAHTHTHVRACSHSLIDTDTQTYTHRHTDTHSQTLTNSMMGDVIPNVHLFSAHFLIKVLTIQ